MTSLGRGRGWASNKEQRLVRPGQSFSPDSQCANLINEIYYVENEAVMKQKINTIRQVLNKTVAAENLQSVMNQLYKQAVTDKDFRRKFMLVFSDPAFQQLSDDKQRSTRYYFLCALQNDYTRRNELRRQNIDLFRNTVCVLCDTHSNIKLNNGDPLGVLALPLLDYMSMLLEIATEEDIKIFAEQIITNGKYHYTKHREEINKLMVNVREVLVTKTISPIARQTLLYVMDIVNVGFQTLPRHLIDFYQLQCVKSYMLQQHQANDREPVNATTKPENDSRRSNANSTTHDANPDVESLNNLMRTPILEETAQSEPVEQKTVPVASNNAVPRNARAIRGSGATTNMGNAAKSHGKPHSSNAPSAIKQYSNNKGWGHDDRFEKDYN